MGGKRTPEEMGMGKESEEKKKEEKGSAKKV
jgi:hypothetical protein